jgi:hypothetical protein
MYIQTIWVSTGHKQGNQTKQYKKLSSKQDVVDRTSSSQYIQMQLSTHSVSEHNVIVE